MLLIDQKVIIKWNGKNKKYYEDKGYIFTNMKQELEINLCDLPLSSKSIVKIQCDYCNKIFEKRYQNYTNEKNKNIIKKDCCKDCASLKNKEQNLLKYGIENASQTEEAKEKRKQTCLDKYGTEYALSSREIYNKRKQTCLDKYGVENYIQTNEFKEKSKQTNLDKYGVEFISQVPKIKNKIKQTNLEKYGVEIASQSEKIKDKIRQTNLKKYNKNYYCETREFKEKVKQTNLDKYKVENVFQSKEIQNKIKQTMLDKYGVENAFQSKEIQNKMHINANKTMYKNGTGPCSKQQKHIHNLVGGELNYPVSRCLLDIAFPEEMIYIEYDGGGHNLQVKIGKITQEDFNIKELNRYSYLKNKGWKLIKIKCENDKLPDNEKIINQIIQAKEYLKEHNWVQLNWDTDPNVVDPLD